MNPKSTDDRKYVGYLGECITQLSKHNVLRFPSYILLSPEGVVLKTSNHLSLCTIRNLTNAPGVIWTLLSKD